MWLIVASIYLCMSAVTLIAYWRDKRAAEHGRWRTPESTLHLLELLGGWPGALLGQRWLRHKSNKMRYRLMLWLIVVLHGAAWYGWWWFMMRERGS